METVQLTIALLIIQCSLYNKQAAAAELATELDDDVDAGRSSQRTSEIRSSSTSNDKVLAMLPVIRFLQLFYENHNRDLQNFLPLYSNKNSYNFVSETLMFIDCIGGSTTGQLGLISYLYINECNVAIIIRTLVTLTEYQVSCLCHENQNCTVNNESNGLDITTALLLEFKNNALASWWTWSVGATTKRPSFTKTALKKSRPVTFTFCATNYWPSTTRTWPLR